MDLQKLNNDVIGTKLNVTRHRDPLQLRVDKANIPGIVDVGVVAKDFKENEARYFVEDHILPYFEDPQDKDATAYFENAQTEFLTPLQASMMLAGCYCYIYDDGHHDVLNVLNVRSTNIELEIGLFPLEPNTRCTLGNPHCRDTPALPPTSSLEWAKARFGREKPIYD